MFKNTYYSLNSIKTKVKKNKNQTMKKNKNQTNNYLFEGEILVVLQKINTFANERINISI